MCFRWYGSEPSVCVWLSGAQWESRLHGNKCNQILRLAFSVTTAVLIDQCHSVWVQLWRLCWTFSESECSTIGSCAPNHRLMQVHRTYLMMTTRERNCVSSTVEGSVSSAEPFSGCSSCVIPNLGPERLVVLRNLNYSLAYSRVGQTIPGRNV